MARAARFERSQNQIVESTFNLVALRDPKSGRISNIETIELLSDEAISMYARFANEFTPKRLEKVFVSQNGDLIDKIKQKAVFESKGVFVKSGVE